MEKGRSTRTGFTLSNFNNWGVISAVSSILLATYAIRPPSNSNNASALTRSRSDNDKT